VSLRAGRCSDTSWVGRRDQGLDALRGVALICVCLFHSGVLPGGWLGVDLFFVISGFWIARALTTQERRLSVFAVRRAARLLPALLVMLCVWTGVVLVWGSSVLGASWGFGDAAGSTAVVGPVAVTG